MSDKVLVVEDDPVWGELIERALSRDFQISSADNVADAKKQFTVEDFDLVLLDIFLPDEQGFQFCEFVRKGTKNPQVPIIILSSKADFDLKVTGFTLGADDYVTKPFESLDLSLKAKASIRRSRLAAAAAQGNGGTAPVIRGALKIDIERQKVFAKDGSQEEHEVEITAMEFRVLLFLARHPGRVFSRDEIMAQVYKDDVYVCDRNIDQIISRLRRKIGPCKDYIRSVYGSGYSFRE
jgi:two-component system, OmpR family, response regulator